jgi:predicted PurR-regulated permease PerM
MIATRPNSRSRFYLVAGILVVVLLSLYLAREILSPFVLAAVTAYIFNPMVSWVSRRGRVRRVWVVLLFYAVGGLIGVWAGSTLVPLIGRQIEDLLKEAPSLTRSVQDFFSTSWTLQFMGITIDLRDVNAQLSQALSEMTNLVSRSALPVIASVVSSVVKVFVYLMVTFYMLLDGERFCNRFVELIPVHRRDDVRLLLGKLNATLAAYIRGQLALFVIMSVATYIMLSVLQVRYALFIAVATGALELIPFAGPYVAGALAITIGFTQPTTPFGWSNLLLVTVIGLGYAVMRISEDNVVIPNLIGRFVDLHPVVVIFVILAGASVAGVLGLLLAVPITAGFNVIATHYLQKYWSTNGAPEVLEERAEAPPEVQKAADAAVSATE